MVDVVTELEIASVLCEIIEELRNKLIRWKDAFDNKSLKVDPLRTKVMVSGSIAKDGLSKSRVDLCGVCILKVKANSFLCVKCGKWVHIRCSGV